MRTNSPFPRNAGRVPVEVLPLPRATRGADVSPKATALNVRAEHGAQALRTIETWLWENSVSTRRRLTLDETKEMWCAMRHAAGACERPVKPKLMTLEAAVQAVVKKHGGVRAAERATGVDKSFISRLMNGHKVAPSAETLEALGLRAVPLYEVLKRPNV
jgi:transcriptional regulator with XRE-family HTH domain